MRIKFEPRDLWVGVYWNRRSLQAGHSIHKTRKVLEVYICLVPCFPICLTWTR